MEYNIGESIKKMRNLKGITQERFANHLGVSAQAVSKWKTSLSMPDIALLPKIARYFNVSIDEVMGFNKDLENKEGIDKVTKESVAYMMGMDMQGAEEVLLKALEEYIGNHELVSALATLYSTWCEAIVSGYFQNNNSKKEEVIEKGIRTCNILIEESKDADSIGCALKNLSILYKNSGNFGLEEKTANKLYGIDKFKLLGKINISRDSEKALGYMQHALFIALARVMDICIDMSDMYSMDLEKAKSYILLGINVLKTVEGLKFIHTNLLLFNCYIVLATINGKMVSHTLESAPDDRDKIESSFSEYLDAVDTSICYFQKCLSDKTNFYDEYHFGLLREDMNINIELSKSWEILDYIVNTICNYPGLDEF